MLNVRYTRKDLKKESCKYDCHTSGLVSSGCLSATVISDLLSNERNQVANHVLSKGYLDDDADPMLLPEAQLTPYPY